MRERTLGLIWQGAIQPAKGHEAHRLKRLLKAMLPLRIVCLSASTGVDRVAVMPDDLEVMPALPLGDVVTEEMGLSVPYGALLMICDEDAIAPPPDDADLSFTLGMAVGQTLLTVLRSGTFPLEREDEALYVMACAFDRMARTTGMRHLGLVPDSFSKGLAGTLGAYWSGSRLSRTEACGLFLEADCLASPQLRRYLKMLDPGFGARPYDLISAGLLAFEGGTRSFPNWLERVRLAVTDTMAPRRTGLIKG